MNKEATKHAACAHFPHDADIGVRGYGQSPGEAFANAARAMSAAVTSLELIVPKMTVRVTCCGPNIEILLTDWLNAVIYEMATRGMLFREFDVEIDGGTLNAEMTGEPVDVVRHAPSVEPKGATLTDLLVARTTDGEWVAQCIVDV